MSKKQKCTIDAKSKYKEIFDKKQKALAALDPAVRRKLRADGVDVLPFKPATVDEVADMIDELRNKYPDPSKFRSEAKKAIEEMKSERINKKIDFFEKQLTDMALHDQIFTNAKNIDEALSNFENLFDVQLDQRINHLTAKNTNMLATLMDKDDLNILMKNDPNIIKQIYNTIEKGFKDNASDEIKKVAMKVKKFNDYLYQQQVDAGFRKGYLHGRTGARTYDGEKLRLNRDQAIIDYMDSIDVEKSFPGLDLRDPEDLLKFEKIATDIIDDRIESSIHGSTIDIAKLDTSGRSNLEARQTRERKIIFKEGKEGDWAIKYGKKTILEQLAEQARTVAKVSATREIMGVNPRATSEKLLRELKTKTVADSPDTYSKINAPVYLDKMWSPYDGTLERLEGSATVAKIFNNIKSVIYMSKLGNTTLSAQADLANLVAALDAATGQGITKSMMDVMSQTIADSPAAFKSYLTGKVPEDVQKRAGELGVFWTSATGEMLKKAGIDGEGSKLFMKLLEIYERVNPIGKQTAFHDMMATYLFQDAFAKMLRQGGSPEIDITMKRAGMQHPAYKELLDASIDDIVHEGNSASIFSPEKVYMVDDEVAIRIQKEIAKSNPSIGAMSLEQFKRDTSSRVQVMFDDFKNTAIPKPGGAVKRKLHVEGKGTIKGELLNSVTMLKSFSFQMLEVNKRIYGSSSKGSMKMKRVSSFYVQMLMMGVWITTLHALAKGESPPDFTKGEAWINAAIRGGAGGIYSDLLLSSTDESYNNFVPSLAGPFATSFESVVVNPVKKAVSSVKSGKNKFEKKDIKPLLRMIPGQNALAIRPLLDFMFLDGLDKSIDPKGYRRRKNLLKKKGQKKLYNKSVF